VKPQRPETVQRQTTNAGFGKYVYSRSGTLNIGTRKAMQGISSAEGKI
jgi:hypothetical protein